MYSDFVHCVFVQWAFCPEGLCPVSFCPDIFLYGVQWVFVQRVFVKWVFIQWAFVQWVFMHRVFCPFVQRVFVSIQWAFVERAFVKWIFVQRWGKKKNRNRQMYWLVGWLAQKWCHCSLHCVAVLCGWVQINSIFWRHTQRYLHSRSQHPGYCVAEYTSIPSSDGTHSYTCTT